MRHLYSAVGAICLILLLVLGLGGCTPAPSKAALAQQAVHVINVHREPGGDVVGNGSGVMIDDFTMLTAAHVVAFSDGKPRPAGTLTIGLEQHPVKVIRVDVRRDIALLRVAVGCPCVPLEIVEEAGSKVKAVGYPINSTVGTQVSTQGELAGETFVEMEEHRDLGDNHSMTVKHRIRFLIATAPIAPGNSGGALLAFQGTRWVLVGLTVAVPNAGSFSPILAMHLPLIVPAASLLAFLEGK